MYFIFNSSQFKKTLIAYKILKHNQPAYISQIIHPYTSSRNTRCSSQKLMLHILFDCKVYNSHKHFTNSFSLYTLALWNYLPFHIRISSFVTSFRGGHGGRVVTLSPPTFEAGVLSLSRPYVEKMVVSCPWLAVYSTQP